jgi:hypothetical protein
MATGLVTVRKPIVKVDGKGQGCEPRWRTRPHRLPGDEWPGSRYDADCDPKVQ